MNKKMLLPLFLVASFAQSEEQIPCGYSGDFIWEKKRGAFGKVYDQEVPQSFDHLVDTCDMFKRCQKLESFKVLEKNFADLGLSIFKVRLEGCSILQWLIKMHGLCEISPERHRDELARLEEVIDYILSKIPAEELNAVIIGKWNCYWDDPEVPGQTTYYAWGTTVAVAALYSPICLRKIIQHPLFDPAHFLKTYEFDVQFKCFTEIKKGKTVTPKVCMQYLKRWQSEGHDQLIEILQQNNLTIE